MDGFDLLLRFRVIYTQDSAQRALSLCQESGAKRVFLVTDPGVRGAGLHAPLARAMQAKEISFEIFSQVEPNPTSLNVAQGLQAAKDFQPDMFLALGGGSAMDCAKAINILFVRGGQLRDYVGLVKGGRDLLPLLALPTTAGTGSEVSPFLLITDSQTHGKLVINDQKAIPSVALLDPNLTVSLPPQTTLYSGIDALVHGCEAFVARGSQPYSKALALKAIGLIVANLPRVMATPKEIESRGRMLIASNLAGLAFSLSYLGLSHATANALAKAAALTHGLAVGLMLPHVICFNAAAVPEEYLQIAQYIFKDQCPLDSQEAARKLADFLEQFCRNLGMPRNLRAAGIREEQIPEMAQEALAQATVKSNPRQPKLEDLLAIFRQAL
jgi:alcohol dehydrogenase class IV